MTTGAGLEDIREMEEQPTPTEYATVVTREDESTEQNSLLRQRVSPSPSTQRNSDSRKSALWRFCGQNLPRSEIVYLCQMLVVFSVVAVSLYNLTSGAGDGKLWTALLSSSLGYVLPAPTISSNSLKIGK